MVATEWWQRAPVVRRARDEVEYARRTIARQEAQGLATQGLRRRLASLERELAALESEMQLRRTMQCPTCSNTTDAGLARCVWCHQSVTPSDTVILGSSGVEIGTASYRKLMEGDKE
jgi:hypothetical protein